MKIGSAYRLYFEEQNVCQFSKGEWRLGNELCEPFLLCIIAIAVQEHFGKCVPYLHSGKVGAVRLRFLFPQYSLSLDCSYLWGLGQLYEIELPHRFRFYIGDYMKSFLELRERYRLFMPPGIV